MSLTRKHVGFLRILGALTLTLLINIGLLYGLDWLLEQQAGTGAFSAPYYMVFALAAFVIFFLLLFPANRPLRRVKGFLRWLLVIVLGLGIWGGGAVWNLQNELLYLPDKYDAADARTVMESPDVQQVDISAAGASGYLWTNGDANQGLVIYFGGNGEFAAKAMLSMLNAQGAAELFKGYRVMAMDYPGYGLSRGQPGEESSYRMALAAWDYAQGLEPKPEKIVLMGWSLGTGTAARLADEKEPAGLVLLAPYFSGARLMDGYAKTRLFDGPLEFLVRNKFLSHEYARTTQARTLIIGASQDNMIPPPQAEDLSQAYLNGTFVRVDGGHTEPRFGSQALTAIAAFLQQALLPAQPAL